MTDGQLLERFLKHNPPGTFEELVRRHGPMVFGVCQRILMNHHDAEEAFQATFLVLARKAKSFVSWHSVAGWLHEVAQRTALNAKRTRTQRQMREKQVELMPDTAAQETGVWSDLAPLLDQELSRLPEKYRVPIVLCDLEGQTQRDAARLLGCPEGTLSSQLTRAREMLRSRLTRHGLTVSTGALVIAITQHAATASVPTTLISSTSQMVQMLSTNTAVTTGIVSPQVAALTEGVLKTMFFSTLKNVIAAVALIALTGLGAGVLMFQMAAAKANPSSKEVLKSLSGTWKFVRWVEGSLDPSPEELETRNQMITFTDEKYILTSSDGGNEKTVEGTLKINTAKRPFEMDVTALIESTPNLPQGNKLPMIIQGIFEVEGDTLNLRSQVQVEGKDLAGNPAKRPTEFKKSNKDTMGDVLATLKRVKP